MDKFFDLTGKVALAVGAGANYPFGQAQALGLAEQGADVIIADPILPDAEEVAGRVRALGRKSLAIQVDVPQDQSAADMVKRVLEQFPRIDILVNCFGFRILLIYE